MTYKELFDQILKKRSFLCVGLDSDLKKIPSFLLETDDPIFEFNKQIIDATKDLCVSYKLNIAFYEAMGVKGWISLEKTLKYIPKDTFIIADAKRGDIGNTCNKYAEAFFETLDCDGLTVAPYMGEDSVSPFLNYPEKWVILLALTSNKGSQDFQFLKSEGKALYQHVLAKSKTWGSKENLMYVVGATHPENFIEIRAEVPDHFLLVPGIGAQGGDLAAVCENGMNESCGLLINSSRSIIYAGNDSDFAEASKNAAQKYQTEMEHILSNKFGT